MTNEEYKIREICGDWALDIPFPSSVITIYFNSLANAELVRDILIHEDEHPNEAVPFNPCTYTPANINREKWEPCLNCKDIEKLAKRIKCWPSYCPVCGRPLTDEAVQMVMERLEEASSE